MAALLSFASTAVAQDAPAPRILLDQSPRAVDYQLRRLSDDQLARVERRADDPRYVPVYYALLSRPMMADAARDEAIAALMALERETQTGVLLNALDRAGDAATARPLLHLLLAQPARDLAVERERLVVAGAREEAGAFLRQGAAVAAVLAGEPADAVWAVVGASAEGQVALLRGMAFLPTGSTGDDVRGRLAPLVQRAIEAPASDDVYRAAIDVWPLVRRDRAAFDLLARQVASSNVPGGALRAVAAIGGLPESVWPAGSIESVVLAALDRVRALSPDERVATDAIDALGVAERLTALLPDGRARAIRADLRSLGVRVVRLETLFEQVAFDRRWFVVEAGRPLQIVFFNPDAMPHNVVIGAPGSLELIGTRGGAMPMPTDPKAKPFVPDVPEVLAATGLVTRGNTERLSLIAPSEPGEYVFACTFPGHWVRMYGVMLVVPNLEAWDAAPTVPTDPMTKQPFASQRME